ncbi:MAG: efflux RND transporter permease subunit [Patescibacteria group bacterium]|nr:efflux RND transporter permease subunit [Patescibacteria group bacterium]
MELNNQPNENGQSNGEKSSDYLYLEKLSFKPELRKGWLNFFVSNFRVVILLIILLTIWGVYSYTQLPLESQPEVKIPYAVVVTTYPGASPADVEELITKKIETKIAGIKDVKTITSNSLNSISSISVEFNAKADLTSSIRNLTDQVNTIKNDLPADANDPIVREISFDDTPIFSFSLAGPYDGFTLRTYAEKIQDELEKISGVRQVNVSGGDIKEFKIAYDPLKLTFYNISPDQANQVIKATNLVVPGGNFEGQKYSYPIKADARFYTTAVIANTPLGHTSEGAVIYLKDVAEVTETAVKRTVVSRFSEKGRPAQNGVNIDVIKKTGGNIVQTADAAKAKINSLLATFPKSLYYDITVDTSEQIKKDFNQLGHDFILTIILVFSILFLIVGLKEAIVAGLAVPLVFFATFGVMLYTGITLNFLSMFSLILALGLLVDDAIVVVSATKQYIKTGKFTPEEAVLLVLNDFKVVLTTTTLTTVWAFLPLLSSTGIIGEFIKSIPITVSVTLISSLIIALIINHPLAAILERVRLTKKIFLALAITLFVIGLSFIFLKSYIGYGLALMIFLVLTLMVKFYVKGGRALMEENYRLKESEWLNDDLIKQKLKYQSEHENGNWFNRLIHGIAKFDRLLPIYEKYLRRVLSTKKNRLATLIIVFVLFAAAVSLPILGVVPSEFFPAADFDYLYIDLTAPVGANLAETDKIASQIENKLYKYQEISNFSTVVGSAGTNSSGFSGSSGNPSNKGQITVKLVDAKQRKLKSYQLTEIIRQDLNDLKTATINVTTPRGGPPSGADFEARIAGDDLQTLDKIAHDLRPFLTAIKGVVNDDISLKDSPADYTFVLDPARLELYDLNAAYVGSIIRMAIAGTKVTTVLDQGKEIDVLATFAEDKLPNLEAIQNLQILNLKKQPVFLRDVARIRLEPSVETISRVDQKRTVLLSASVTKDNLPAAVVKEFQNKVEKNYRLPSGYNITYGGQNEENNESVASILRAMVLAALLIVSTLIIQFNSFKKALIVLVTIPLALIGVFFGMAIFHLTLSFPGLIGIVALFGIVVKNAIILIDKINLNLKSKIPFSEAIVDAGKSRLEAIIITSICTIVGIIPVTLSNETWTALGGAIIFGLMLSSFFTLFIVPILFITLIRPEERF